MVKYYLLAVSERIAVIGDEVGGCAIYAVISTEYVRAGLGRKVTRRFHNFGWVKVSGMIRITDRCSENDETHGTVDFSNRGFQ